MTAALRDFDPAYVRYGSHQRPVDTPAAAASCPLHPRKRTNSRCLVTSASSQKRTYAPQQTATYSITSSARASSDGGTSRPSDLAVFWLITSSYLVGACTGRSAGFAPLRIRST